MGERSARAIPRPKSGTGNLSKAFILLGIESIFAEGYRYKKAGVMLTELVPARIIQANCFDSRDRYRALKLMEVMDQVNARMGAGTLKFAAVELKQPWRLKAEHRPGAYTTRWNELLRV